jgi:hypothetical protein
LEYIPSETEVCVSFDLVFKIVGASMMGVIGVLNFFTDVMQHPNTRWVVVALAFGGLVCFAIAEVLTERKRKREQQQRDLMLPGLIADAIAKRLPNKADSVPTVEEKTLSADRLSPDQQLQRAQEAVFIQEVVALPIEELKVKLGYDVELRNKFNAVPRGKYQQFDHLKESIAHAPIIDAQFLRAHLMPSSPYSGMVKDIFRAAGRTSYEASADFLFEIHMVNVTTNTTTLRDVIAEAEIDGKWVTLPRIDDLSDYELVPIKSEEDIGALYPVDIERVPLDNLWSKIQGIPPQHGIGYKGWLRFNLTTDSPNLEKIINHKVRFTDAMGGNHPVMKIGEFLTPHLELRHNIKKLLERAS